MISLINNRLTLGTVQFGLNYGISNTTGKVSRDEVFEILRIAKCRGVNILDTAMSYGDSESVLGEFGVKEFMVITKLPPLNCDESEIETFVDNAVLSSLKKLRLVSIYALLVHKAEDLHGTSGRILMRSLIKLRDSGIISKIGVSIYDPDELNAIKDIQYLDIVQAPLSQLDRRLVNSGWLDKLKDYGIEVHVRSIFLQGLLLMPYQEIPPKFLRWKEVLREWSLALEKEGITALEACLGYPLLLPKVDQVIVGVNGASHFLELLELNSRLSRCDYQFCDISSEDVDLINPSRWNEL
jgi:aryl-alcohol dehydrogenase-like predicted oxidoreductase